MAPIRDAWEGGCNHLLEKPPRGILRSKNTSLWQPDADKTSAEADQGEYD